MIHTQTGGNNKVGVLFSAALLVASHYRSVVNWFDDEYLPYTIGIESVVMWLIINPVFFTVPICLLATFIIAKPWRCKQPRFRACDIHDLNRFYSIFCITQPPCNDCQVLCIESKVSLIDWEIHNPQSHSREQNPFYSYDVLNWLLFDMSILWIPEIEARVTNPAGTGQGQET